MSDTAGGSPPPLAFGVNVGWMHTGPAGGPAGSPADAARAAEAAGFDVVTAADHVGRTSPLVALAAAAAVTTRVRLRTYVLDAAFWNPLDALLQQVVVDADPEASAAAFAAGASDVADVLDSPFLLYARTPDDAAADLVRRAQRWGITSWCAHAPSAPGLAAVLKAYRS